MASSHLNIGITCYPTYGGSGVIATEIGMAMAKRGHKVHFICYDVPRRLQLFTENIFFHEVEVHEYPLFTYPPYSLSLASKMVEVTTYERLDLLHVHYAVPHATSAYLAKQILGDQAPKIITTLHGTDITLVGNERSYLPITRFSIAQSDGISAPSQYLKHATYDKLNVPTSCPIEVIPNFVDIEHYRPLHSDEKASSTQRHFLQNLLGTCPVQENIRILSHVSNFRPVKRVLDVVRIFNEVLKEHRAHLLLVGDGPERSRAEELVRQLGIAEHVCFLGKQEAFVGILQYSDVFLLPSESESFGLAALEAMSCGVPIVASNTQGIPEVVEHGVTGFLADVGDVEQMSRHVTKILDHTSLKTDLSVQARNRVVANFSLERVVNQYEAYYYSTLEKK